MRINLRNVSDASRAREMIRENYENRTAEQKEKLGHGNFQWLIYCECDKSDVLLNLVIDALHDKKRIVAILPDRPMEIARVLAGEPGTSKFDKLMWYREYLKWVIDDYLPCNALEFNFIPLYDDHNEHGAILLDN